MTQADDAYSPIPFTQVTFNDSFWTPRLETNRTVTIPYDFEKCDETGRLTNFDKAAGRMEHGRNRRLDGYLQPLIRVLPNPSTPFHQPLVRNPG